MEKRRKTRIGQVLSNKMEKTVVVGVETPKKHPLYKKSIRRTVKYYAHDENRMCQVGDLVRIEETRPLSRLKRWRVVEVLARGKVAEVKPEEITT